MKINSAISHAFARIETRFNDETLEEFLNTPINDVIAKYQTLSAWIKLFVLSPKSSTYKYFLKKDIHDKQMMADILLIEFYNYKNLSISM